MPTPRPFGAPTTFSPRFTPQGLNQRSLAEVNSQVARMRNLAGRGFGPFPVDGPVGPRSSLPPISNTSASAAGAGGLLNTIGRSAAGFGALMYGSQKLKELLRQAGIIPPPLNAVGAIPPKDRSGESYRDAERRLSAAAARAGGGPSVGGGIGGGNAASSLPPLSSASSFGTGTPAAERAYRQEVSSVAQQAAQNPELKRYEDARLKAVAPGATPEQVQSAEDIGMQIWKKKYGGTPLARRGGSIGIDNPLMASTFGYQSGSAPDQQMGAPTIGPTPLVPQIDQSLNPASPNFIGGEGAPLMDFSRDNVTPEMIQAYQKQLLQQATSRK
jgi:hypothetical protein